MGKGGALHERARYIRVYIVLDIKQVMDHWLVVELVENGRYHIKASESGNKTNGDTLKVHCPLVTSPLATLTCPE